jgi:hypothetical protein
VVGCSTGTWLCAKFIVGVISCCRNEFFVFSISIFGIVIPVLLDFKQRDSIIHTLKKTPHMNKTLICSVYFSKLRLEKKVRKKWSAQNCESSTS